MNEEEKQRESHQMRDYRRPERQIAQTVSLTCGLVFAFHGAKTTVQPRSYHKKEFYMKNNQSQTGSCLAGGSGLWVSNDSIITVFQTGLN